MPGMLTTTQTDWMTAMVARSLDKSLPLKRKSSTRTFDSYGHETTPLVSVGNIACTVSNPTASQLELYAEIIGSQRAMMLRAMSTTDIREGDIVTYDGLDWTLHGVEHASSYSFTKDYVMTVTT